MRHSAGAGPPTTVTTISPCIPPSDECDQFKIKAQSNKIFEANQEHNIIDLFEDNMLEEVDSSGILELKDPADFFFEI